MSNMSANRLPCLRAMPAAGLRSAMAISSALLLMAGTPLANPATKDIKAYFASVPTEVFDDTTDGLDEDQRKILLAKGRSEDWIFRRIHAGKAILKATHPSSIVTMTLMKLGEPVMQVHIQNERAETISYWVLAKEGEPLQKHMPALALQAAAAAHHDIHGDSTKGAGGPVDPLAGMPSAIISHVNALESCQKVTGSDSTKAPAQTDLRCSERPAIEAELRRTHKTPIAKTMLDRAKALIGQ